MELKQLEAYLHVAELGSFTRAATILDTNQPALSRLVRQLEIELRQNLLVRDGRGVSMTEAGKVFLAHAQSVVHQIERATQDMNQLRGAHGGHFNIGLVPTIARVATLELVRHYRSAFPHATLSVTDGLSTNLNEWLIMGRIDAAVLYDTSHSTLIERKLLLEEELYLIGPAGAGASEVATIAFAGIAAYKLIIPGRLHAIRHTIETRAAELGVKLTVALEVNAVSSILDLVWEGHGYAVLPMNAIANDPLNRQFSLARMVDPTPTTRLILATSKRHPLSQLANKAIAMLEREVLPCFVGSGATE